MTDSALPKPPITFSIWGFGLGALAFALVIIQYVAGPFAPQPDVGQSLGQMAGEMARAAVGSFFGREPETVDAVARPWDIDRAMLVGSMALAGVAIFLGGLGLIRHEAKRAVAAALGMGTLAITLQFIASTILMILGVILILGVIAAVGDVLGDFGF